MIIHITVDLEESMQTYLYYHMQKGTQQFLHNLYSPDRMKRDAVSIRGLAETPLVICLLNLQLRHWGIYNCSKIIHPGFYKIIFFGLKIYSLFHALKNVKTLPNLLLKSEKYTHVYFPFVKNDISHINSMYIFYIYSRIKALNCKGNDQYSVII